MTSLLDGGVYEGVGVGVGDGCVCWGRRHAQVEVALLANHV